MKCRKEPFSGAKKEHETKLLSPDIFQWGRCLPHEGVGAKKFGMSLETREIKLFLRDIPGFCWDVPAAPEKFERKGLCSILYTYICNISAGMVALRSL